LSSSENYFNEDGDENDDVQVSVRFFDKKDSLFDEAGLTKNPFTGMTRYLSFNTRDAPLYLDSLGGIYGVELRQFDSTQHAREQDAVVVRRQASLLSVGDEAEQPVIAMSDYRGTLLRSLGVELLFSCLLLAALAFAGYSAYRSLREHRRQLADREALLANLSHELKTPIAAVSVALEALDRFGVDAHPDRRRDYINLSRQELERLDRLADYAIGTLRIDSTTTTVPREQIDVIAACEHVWSGLALQYGLPADSLDLVVQGHSAPTSVFAHEFKLALTNLLDNAIKYGGHPPEVRLTLAFRQEGIRCIVEDNGRGIAPGERERIFERFYRIADERAGHSVKGHGLGLSLVRQVAELHGGTVRVGTSDAGGTSFILQIPGR
ncbi:MAG: HAMP domain-containing sensor histidine kinase, partial [Lewinella sp.]